MMRTYDELIKLKTFKERYEYLKLDSRVGAETFGYDRYLNQALYQSQKWRQTRSGIIIRDNGCDLGLDDYEILDRIIVHHMNPITIEDIENEDPKVFDPRFLISTSPYSHNGIHYGEAKREFELKERTKNDMCPWLT